MVGTEKLRPLYWCWEKKLREDVLEVYRKHADPSVLTLSEDKYRSMFICVSQQCINSNFLFFVYDHTTLITPVFPHGILSTGNCQWPLIIYSWIKMY